MPWGVAPIGFIVQLSQVTREAWDSESWHKLGPCSWMRPPVFLVLVLLLVALWARQNPEQLKVRIYNGLAVRRRCKVQKAAANISTHTNAK